MSVYYADTSAAIKLLVAERHSQELASFYDDHAEAEWVSSALLRIEVARTIHRAFRILLPEARELLTIFSYIAVDDEIVEAAMNEPERSLRSLDAIHLATARLLVPELDALVSYDDKMIKAAADAGITCISPGVAADPS